MHLLKHYLTIEEKEHLKLYSQMIDSKDVESKKLACSLCYEEFKKYKCPNIMQNGRFGLMLLRDPDYTTVDYWKDRIQNLIRYNYYCY